MNYRMLTWGLALAVATSPMAAMAQEAGFAQDTFQLPPTTTPSAPAGQSENLPAPSGGAQAAARSTIYLGSDGNLAGRVFLLTPQGTRVPVQGDVSFVQDGRVVLQTRSDDRGMYQAVGLRPGVYSVVVMSDAGGSVSQVQVLPFDPNAEPTAMILELPVVPGTDMQMLTQMLGQQIVPPPAMPPAMPAGAPGFMGGGVGGPGGHNWGMLGTILGGTGLGFGIAALADDDDDRRVVSPFIP